MLLGMSVKKILSVTLLIVCFSARSEEWVRLERDAGNLVIADNVEGGGGFVSFVNLEAGAGTLYDLGFFGQSVVLANVEAGHIWGGHEVFNRETINGFSTSPSVFLNAPSHPDTSPQLGEFDYHATMVGHVLGGTGHQGGGTFGALGMGMAPLATLWSGAVATHFDPLNIGAFSISMESFMIPYTGFFRGIEEGKSDVINSSWGFAGAGDSVITRTIDALAAENPTVTSVMSAGNSGPGSGTVGEPGAGHNSITVGALEAASFDGENTGATDFSSRGPVSFYNPLTDELIANARPGVHLAAPGENMALAAYLGNTGGLTGLSITESEPSDNLYFTYSMSGTSFSSPVVAGGVGLLKDVAYSTLIFEDVDTAVDTRVIRSVLMAGARATPGWDNNQQVVDGVVTTQQVLDHATGAGALDLTRALEIYAFHTANLSGVSGGTVSSEAGWDFGQVEIGLVNDYVFSAALDPMSELTISLNWFTHQALDAETAELVESTARFADLNLEVWRMEGDAFSELYATSNSVYSNAEFLRLLITDGGEFGFRVIFEDWVYNATSEINVEDYAVAWSVVVIPEPGTLALVLTAFVLFWLLRRRADHTSLCRAHSSRA
jgi:hypothetical protein